MMDFIIGIVAVKKPYVEKTKNLIDQILTSMDVNFLVLTDFPEEFAQMGNVRTVKYTKSTFSFHDKRIIFEEGFKTNDTVLLLDADHGVRDNNSLKDAANLDLEPGVYPQVLWKHPASCSFENFIQGLTSRVPYGIEYKKLCELLGLSLDGVVLIQESFVIIKKNDQIETFLKTWERLAEFCENDDRIRNQHVLGYGEGYSIGVAVKNSNLTIHENHPKMQMLAKNFKHFAWEK